MVRIAQRVVRGAARLDADQLHCRRQRLLRRAGAGLRVEDHLRVVPCLDPVRLSVVQQDVVLEHADVVKTPRQENALSADPCAETLKCLRKGQTFLAQLRVAQTGELGNATVELFIILRADEHLKFVRHRSVLQKPHCADLDDLSVDLHGKYFLCGIGTRPRLIPFHVQNDKLHGVLSCKFSIFNHITVFRCLQPKNCNIFGLSCIEWQKQEECLCRFCF